MNYNKRLIKNFSNCCQDSLMGGVLHDPPPFPFFPLPYLLSENVFFSPLLYNPLFRNRTRLSLGGKWNWRWVYTRVSRDGAKVKELRARALGIHGTASEWGWVDGWMNGGRERWMDGSRMDGWTGPVTQKFISNRM